ncbi:hypothetical protein B0T22DRAFT_266305 [Podospora appendiculata]|uniref:Transmembrane protein n=1 Tax=Podospora appendiculata TaxID=314037 RepID=A0AAE1C9C9_9PEZI|nr:hypothetical protein B0T22DRAFT_266305 [Podospora appendiculata]
MVSSGIQKGGCTFICGLSFFRPVGKYFLFLGRGQRLEKKGLSQFCPAYHRLFFFSVYSFFHTPVLSLSFSFPFFSWEPAFSRSTGFTSMGLRRFLVLFFFPLSHHLYQCISLRGSKGFSLQVSL